MSNNYCNFFIIFFFYQYIYIISSICPPDLILKPCYCYTRFPYYIYSSYSSYQQYNLYEESIVCSNIHDPSFNLQTVFLKINSYSNIVLNDDENATHFNYFILSNTTLSTIPENVFHNITFKSLMLQNNFQLTTIHQNAFTHTKNYVQSFETINTSLSDSDTLFSILKQFQNLRYLSMQNDQIKSIPNYAFNHTHLTHIYFGYEYSKQSQPIESIGDYAFYNLPNINVISIFSPVLTKITKYSLAQQKDYSLYHDRDKVLEILIGGENLTSTSFELTSLSRFRSRRVFIHFYNTNIAYLDQNVFQPYLEGNPYSAVDIGPTNILFECDCRSAWIQRDYLRNVDLLEHRVYGYECSRYDFAKLCTINK